MPKKQRSTDGIRRRGTRGGTRERLVKATLELLDIGGEPAVSTVSVTRGAGIVQSGFYRHFANVGDCLAAVAEQAAGQIRQAVAEARCAMYQSGPGTGQDLEQFYRGIFGLASRHRAMTVLFLRYRTDTLALGGVMQRLAGDLRSDLARDLTTQAARSGWSEIPSDWVEALADNLVGATLAAIEARLDGRGPDVAGAARVLAAFSTGACLGVIEALRSSGSPGLPTERAPAKRPRGQ